MVEFESTPIVAGECEQSECGILPTMVHHQDWADGGAICFEASRVADTPTSGLTHCVNLIHTTVLNIIVLSIEVNL